MKKTAFLWLYAVYCSSLFAQNDIKEYRPPKIMEGSELLIFSDARTRGSNSNSFFESEGFSLNGNFSALLTKWKYTDRFNYFSRVYAAPQVSYMQTNYDTITSTSYYMNLEGGMNFYPIKNLLYAGVNGAFSANFYDRSKPSFSNYIGPNIGSGRILNASQVEKTENFQKVLKDEKIIGSDLPQKVRKKLTALFDRRINREFI